MLNRLGNYGMYIGTVVALIGGARIPPEKTLFILGFIVLMAGVVLKQMGKKQVVQSIMGGKIQEISTHLKEVYEQCSALNTEKGSLSIEELHEKVDRITAHTIYRFAQGLDTIKISLGLPAYNDIMTSFAPGERYLNRVWSASTDGYDEEAHDYLEMCIPQFQDAHEKLQKYLQQA